MEYSNVLQRNNPFVTTLGTTLGLSSTDIDNLFITAWDYKMAVMLALYKGKGNWVNSPYRWKTGSIYSH